MNGKYTLHTHTGSNSTNRKGFVNSSAFSANNDSTKNLDNAFSPSRTLTDLNPVSHLEMVSFFLQIFACNLFQQLIVHRSILVNSWLLSVSQVAGLRYVLHPFFRLHFEISACGFRIEELPEPSSRYSAGRYTVDVLVNCFRSSHQREIILKHSVLVGHRINQNGGWRATHL